MMTKHFNVPDTAPIALRALQQLLERGPLVWVESPLMPKAGHYKVKPDKRRDDK